jgi:thiol-disulfide isomerase/thioredoxin
MHGDDLLSRYNYDEFAFHKFESWLNFDASPPLDRPAPDFPLWDLDEWETSLATIWSDHSFTVVEFGSITCPHCKIAAPAMNAIAREYGPKGIGFYLIYTHEVNPGEIFPYLTSMAQKFHHARMLRDLVGVTRSILVDSLDGACHRAYGSMPNMTWIFGQDGFPVYKSSWTDVHSVANTLEYLLGVLERQRAGEQLRPIQVEYRAFQTERQSRFQQELAHNGPKAVEEYQGAFREYLTLGHWLQVKVVPG